MARGWESKSVENQQTEELSQQAPTTSHQQELESLNLQRTRILNELERSINPRFQAHQQKSLEFLNYKLKQLSDLNFQTR